MSKPTAAQTRQKRLTLSFRLRRLPLSWLPDTVFLKLMYRVRLGRKLNLRHPETFSEKLQYLKIHDQKPLFTRMADKHTAKQYVAELLGQDMIIPTLGIWERFDDIDFSALPEQFVLKCTHDSGSAVICRNKKEFDFASVKADYDTRLQHNYYDYFREWPYKDIPPRVLAETYMKDPDGPELKDYKFFCFHGKPAFIQVDLDRFTNHKRNLYTPQWERLDWSYHYPTESEKIITKPEMLEQMLSIAETLAKDIAFVRVDLYCIQHKIYFGECTFYPSAGYPEFFPDSVNKTIGDMLHLS